MGSGYNELVRNAMAGTRATLRKEEVQQEIECQQ
jgi:hypothetical protein